MNMQNLPLMGKCRFEFYFLLLKKYSTSLTTNVCTLIIKVSYYVLCITTVHKCTSQVVPVIKKPPTNVRDSGSIPGSGRSPGGGHGDPLQYSCLENPLDRGAWRATVHRVTQSWTRLKRLSTHAQFMNSFRLCFPFSSNHRCLPTSADSPLCQVPHQS